MVLHIIPCFIQSRGRLHGRAYLSVAYCRIPWQSEISSALPAVLTRVVCYFSLFLSVLSRFPLLEENLKMTAACRSGQLRDKFGTNGVLKAAPLDVIMHPRGEDG